MLTDANGTPRRIKMQEWTPAERAIFDAVQAVERLPADVRLTEAVILLGKAREQVADYVDWQLGLADRAGDLPVSAGLSASDPSPTPHPEDR